MKDITTFDEHLAQKTGIRKSFISQIKNIQLSTLYRLVEIGFK